MSARFEIGSHRAPKFSSPASVSLSPQARAASLSRLPPIGETAR